MSRALLFTLLMFLAARCQGGYCSDKSSNYFTIGQLFNTSSLFAGQSEGSGLTETEYTNEGSSDLINNEATDRISDSKNFRSSPGATPHLKANQFDIYPYCSILANENWVCEKVFVFWVYFYIS